MVFSFGNDREHLSLAGNSGFPVRDALPQAAERLGDAPGGTRRMKARGSCERGLRSMPGSPKVARQHSVFSRAAEPDTRPKSWPDPTEAGDAQGR